MSNVHGENTASILAAFATLKSLSDEKKYQSPYQILGEFIRYVITTVPLYRFSTIEMKGYLIDFFGFIIPEAVIKTSLKNINGLSLCDKMYNVSMNEIDTGREFEIKQKEANDCNLVIIQKLIQYISNRSGESIDEKILTKELINFLTEDTTYASSKYTELIGEFILKNEQNTEIQDNLNKIREGSILYMGLSCDIRETGSLKNPLTLYLGTEILFSLIGYNGNIHQQLANDFYEQIQTVNSGNDKKITLYFFSETRKEIDDFFDTASSIVERKKESLITTVAMKAITDNCKTSADVEVKKSDFYHKLKSKYRITEYQHNISYYNECYFSSNLESFEYDEDDYKKKDLSLKLISHINKLRNGKHYCSDIDSEYLVVSNSGITLRISKEQSDKIKKETNQEVCNFAVSLDRITSLLWYKLGKGFGRKVYPANVAAILKARIVLSSNIARNAEKAFSEVTKQYKNGDLTEDQLIARILMLRNKPSLPEDLQGDDIDGVMDFSPEYLSRYEEQIKSTQKSLKEKELVIETLKENQKEKEILIKEKDEKNAELERQLEELKQEKLENKRRKEHRKNICKFIWSISWKLLVLIVAIIIFILFSKVKGFSMIATSIFSVAELLGILLSFRQVICKDWKKYFSNSKGKVNDEDSYF